MGSLGLDPKPLSLMLQDGRLVDLTGNAVNDSSGKILVARVEGLEVDYVLDCCRALK